MLENLKPQKLTCSINSYESHYQGVRLVLDPEELRVSTTGLIGGDGVSPDLWYNRHITLFQYSQDCLPGGVENFLRMYEEEILKIASMYQGEDDGGRGIWDDWMEVSLLCDQLSHKFEESECPQYSDASDFLAGDSDRYKYAKDPNRELVLDRLIEDGEYNDFHVRREDLNDELDRLAEEEAA